MTTGLREIWKLEPCAESRLDPRAEAFKTAFQEQLRSINRFLLCTSTHGDAEWYNQQVYRRNKLMVVYQSALKEYYRESSSAYSIGIKALQGLKALAADVAGYSG